MVGTNGRLVTAEQCGHFRERSAIRKGSRLGMARRPVANRLALELSSGSGAPLSETGVPVGIALFFRVLGFFSRYLHLVDWLCSIREVDLRGSVGSVCVDGQELRLRLLHPCRCRSGIFRLVWCYDAKTKLRYSRSVDCLPTNQGSYMYMPWLRGIGEVGSGECYLGYWCIYLIYLCEWEGKSQR